jgi:hypothetical protein
VFGVKRHRESIPLARISQGPAFKPGTLDSERTRAVIGTLAEATRCVQWVGDRQHKPASFGKDTANLVNCGFHVIDVLKAHEGDSAVCNRVGKRKGTRVAQENWST